MQTMISKLDTTLQVNILLPTTQNTNICSIPTFAQDAKQLQWTFLLKSKLPQK